MRAILIAAVLAIICTGCTAVHNTGAVTFEINKAGEAITRAPAPAESLAKQTRI